MKEGSTGLLQQVCSLSDEKSMPADSAIKPNITRPLINLTFTLLQKHLQGKISSWVSTTALLMEVELMLNTKTEDVLWNSAGTTH